MTRCCVLGARLLSFIFLALFSTPLTPLFPYLHHYVIVITSAAAAAAAAAAEW